MKKLILSTLLLTIISLGVNPAHAQEPGVVAEVTDGNAVEAKSNSGVGVLGVSESGNGVNGVSNSPTNSAGLFINKAGIGLESTGKTIGGFFKTEDGSGVGIRAISITNNAFFGTSDQGTGIFGKSNTGTGVLGESISGHGVSGITSSSIHIAGHFNNINQTGGIGIHATGKSYAGFFIGRVHVTEVVTAQNISQSSDRNLKSNFTPLNGKDVLKKLMTIPVQKWNYKNESASVLHIGPTAQDFHKAFNVGYDDKTISTVDANGVALAAIQGLYEMIKERDVQLEKQSQQIAELTKQVQALTGKQPEKTQKVRKSRR